MASSGKRCYFLELPPEIRVIIYNLSFSGSPENKLKRAAEKRSLRDAKDLASQTKLMRTSRQILCEATPAYQRVVQTEIELLKDALVERALVKVTKYDEPQDPTDPFAGVMQHGQWIGAIEGLGKAIKGLQGSLKKWSELEKDVSAATEAERQLAATRST